MPTANMALPSPCPSTATMVSASTRLGTLISASLTRLSAPSIRPGKKPASTPDGTPSSRPTATTSTAASSDTRAPKISRLSWSRPYSSVPSQCCAE
jgi:hypothetical protein